MAKVIIEIQDGAEHGMVDLDMNFYPELPTEEGATMTPAQIAALRMTQYLTEMEQ